MVLAMSVLLPAAAYLGVLAALILLIEARKSRQFLGKITESRSALPMFLCIVLSVMFSRAILLSLGAGVLIGLNLALYFILAVEFENMDWRLCYRLLNITCILASIYGLYQFFSGNININASWVDKQAFGELVRIYSTLSNPNVFAGYLALNLSFSIAKFKGIWEDKLLTLSILLSSICLLLTYSRGGFAAFCAAMLTLYLLKRRKGVLVYLFTVIALFALINTTGNLNRADVAIVYKDSSSLYRLEIWKSAVQMFLKRPILGNGIGTTWYFLSGGSDKLFKIVLHSHNIFLQVAAEMGAAGLAAFIYLIVKNIMDGCKILGELGESEEAAVVEGFLAGIAGIIVHGMVDAVIFIPTLSLILVGYFALYKGVLKQVQCRTERAEFLFYRQGVLKLFSGKSTGGNKSYEEENEACEA